MHLLAKIKKLKVKIKINKNKKNGLILRKDIIIINDKFVKL